MMDIHFKKVKDYLIDLEYNISYEEEETGVFVVNGKEDGINNLVIGCSDPILILEQHIFDMPSDSMEVYKALLIKNRDIVHGAFVLNEDGQKVIFRDTLQLENLDKNELDGSISSLSLLLSEYSDELIQFSKK